MGKANAAVVLQPSVPWNAGRMLTSRRKGKLLTLLKATTVASVELPCTRRESRDYRWHKLRGSARGVMETSFLSHPPHISNSIAMEDVVYSGAACDFGGTQVLASWFGSKDGVTDDRPCSLQWPACTIQGAKWRRNLTFLFPRRAYKSTCYPSPSPSIVTATKKNPCSV